MGFLTEIPDNLTFKKGGQVLASEDKKEIAEYEKKHKYRKNKILFPDKMERIIFFGSGFGEFIFSQLLVKNLQDKNFDFHWWLTFFNQSFHNKIEEKICKNNSLELYNESMIEILDRISPTLLCVLEFSHPLEMAKMMRLCCGWRKIPVFLLSAKMRLQWAERISHYGKRNQYLYQKAYQAVSYAVTDDLESAKTLLELKINKNRIFMGDSLKWHTGQKTVSKKIRKKVENFWNLKNKKKLILILASLHEDEIFPILNIIRKLIMKKKIKTILAPHFSLSILKTAGLIIKSNLSYTKWSEMRNETDSKSDILLIDKYGELRSIYSAGDISYIGGGFGFDSHGHNMVEAVAENVPVIIGPDYNNFKNIVEPLIKKEGICVAKNFNDLSEKLEKIVDDNQYRQKMVQNAASLYEYFSNKESLEYKLLLKFLSDRDC